MQKKYLFLVLILPSIASHAVSHLDVLTRSSMPYLYNAMSFEDNASSSYFSVKAYSGFSIDEKRMARSITMNGKPYFTMSEVGATATSTEVTADMNPHIVHLTDHTSGLGHLGDYQSTVYLKPKLRTFGALLHFYKKWDGFFVDVRSALLSCRTHIVIDEIGGGNGQHLGIADFKDAMAKSLHDHGKMGEEQKKTGLDDIQCKFGIIAKKEQTVFVGYALLQVPTGRGSKSVWMFEPRVGKNHLGIGFGAEDYILRDSWSCVVGGNWRYLCCAGEKRSFDLEANGPWSRYLNVVTIPAPSGGGKSTPGINYLTRDVKVTPGNQLNTYVHFVKELSSVKIKASYSFLAKQKEKISGVSDASTNFGVYYHVNGAGNTTDKATINSYKLSSDGKQISAFNKELNLNSGAVSAIVMSSVSAALGVDHKGFQFDVGASIDIPHSESAYSFVGAWLKIGCAY